jgi:hypothetical protein
LGAALATLIDDQDGQIEHCFFLVSGRTTTSDRKCNGPIATSQPETPKK